MAVITFYAPNFIRGYSGSIPSGFEVKSEDVKLNNLINIPTRTEQLFFEICDQKSVELFIKRDDLIHAEISGNKWRKLKYNMIAAKANDARQLLTFGGAFSNHIAATARAGEIFGINTTGIIRGEEVLPLNPTLAFAKKCGMNLHYVSRKQYGQKISNEFLELLKELYGDFYMVPDGGANHEGIRGCAEIIDEIDFDFDYICTPCGTGTTLTGLITGLKEHQGAIGFSALKGEDRLSREVKAFLGAGNCHNWKISFDFHFGGYAKYNPVLVEFIKMFKELTDIILDPLYTGKMAFGVLDLIKKDFFKPGSKIVMLHTGGLQGIEGYNSRFKVNLPLGN